MKIAFCFYGLVGSKNKKYGEGEHLDPSEAFTYYKKNVFSKISNYDIFIHSQSINFKNQLLKIYKPKAFIFEKQKDFSFKMYKNKFFLKYLIISVIKFLINFFVKKKFDINIKKYFIRGKNNYSRWYSVSKVVNLMNDFQKKNNLRYDLVLLTRLDVAFLTPFDLSGIDSDKMNVSHHNEVPSPRNNYKAIVHKNDSTFEKGISDFWFLSNSENIIKFAKLFYYLDNYSVSAHMCSLQHIRYLNLNINLFRFRGIDHELIRRLKKSKE